MRSLKPDTFEVVAELDPASSQNLYSRRTPGNFMTNAVAIEATVPALLSHFSLCHNPRFDGDASLLILPGDPYEMSLPFHRLYGTGGASADFKNLSRVPGQAKLTFQRAASDVRDEWPNLWRNLATVTAIEVQPGQTHWQRATLYSEAPYASFFVVSTGRGALQSLEVGYELLNDEPIPLEYGRSELFRLERPVTGSDGQFELTVQNTGDAPATYCAVLLPDLHGETLRRLELMRQEEQRTVGLQERYTRAIDSIRQVMTEGDSSGPPSLRAVNALLLCARIDTLALVQVLVKKGLLSQEEYASAMAEFAEDELERQVAAAAAPVRSADL